MSFLAGYRRKEYFWASGNNQNHCHAGSQPSVILRSSYGGRRSPHLSHISSRIHGRNPCFLTSRVHFYTSVIQCQMLCLVFMGDQLPSSHKVIITHAFATVLFTSCHYSSLDGDCLFTEKHTICIHLDHYHTAFISSSCTGR